MNIINVAIDGPAGAGKSTIARAASKTLGFIYVDTGAMYRAAALYALNSGIDCDDEEKVTGCLENIDIELSYVDGEQRIFLNGEDVSDKIRTAKVSMGASAVAKNGAVRKKLVSIQQNIAKKNNVIMDGRDIGTCVLPDADLKIFLTASVDARAKRRYDELVLKGEKQSIDEVREDIIKRDKNDSERKNSPLRRAEDAVLVDTSDMTLEESIESIVSLIKKIIKD